MSQPKRAKLATLPDAITIHADRELFLDALLDCSVVSVKSVAIPAYEHARIDVGKGLMTLTATDGELCVRRVIIAEASAPGSFTIHVNRTLALIKTCVADLVITVASTAPIENALPIGNKPGNQMAYLIESGRSRLRAPSVMMDELPEYHAAESLLSNFDSPSFSIALKMGAACFSSDESRFQLNAVHLRRKGKQLWFESTNGVKAVIAAIAVPDMAAEFDVIVPRRAVGALVAFTQSHPNFDLKLDDHWMTLAAHGHELTTRLLPGQFPNFDEVFRPFDRAGMMDCTVSADAMLAVFARFLCVRPRDMSKGRQLSRVRADITEKEITLQQEDEQTGEARDVVACEFDGEPLTIFFDRDFMADLIGLCGEQARITIDANPKNMMIQPATLTEGFKRARFALSLCDGNGFKGGDD